MGEATHESIIRDSIARNKSDNEHNNIMIRKLADQMLKNSEESARLLKAVESLVGTMKILTDKVEEINHITNENAGFIAVIQRSYESNSHG